jgi:hypothetical protein
MAISTWGSDNTLAEMNYFCLLDAKAMETVSVRQGANH